jgi:hypothetical protein
MAIGDVALIAGSFKFKDDRNWAEVAKVLHMVDFHSQLQKNRRSQILEV